jgi:hypothetical protein
MDCARGRRGEDGAFCPEIAHAPVTIEGRAVAAIMTRHGVWKRAGLSGMVSGLDLAEACAALPRCDRAFAIRLFIIAERAWVNAAAALIRTKDDNDG